MTLTELRYVVALYDTGHFRRAAESCHVSQPTLSVAIKRLEEELGVSLFERSRHRVAPTDVGERFAAQARNVLRESDSLKTLAEEGKDPLGSMLRVGAIYTVGPYLFPRLVTNLQSLAPHMPLSIKESFTADLRAKLRTGELDAAFIALPFTETDVVTQTVYNEPFVVLLSPEHPLVAKDAIDPAELAAHSVLLLGEGHCFRDQVLDASPGLRESLEQSRSIGHSVVEGSSLETLKHMVASGLGITVLPKSAAGSLRYGDHELVTRPFIEPAPRREVALAWRASFPRHQAIDVISQAARG